MKTVLAVVLGTALLAGCAVRPVVETDAARAAYDNRAEAIGTWTRWGLSGRLGIDGGDDGGSGRLNWVVGEEGSSLQFRGALGRGAWRLSIEQQGATLEKADGTVTRAPSADTLALMETGWEIPVAALAWWVRGLARPGGRAPMDIDAEGLPLTLEQDGWRVSFERFDDSGDVRLPKRIEAVKGDYRVKLAISRWWHEGDA